MLFKINESMFKMAKYGIKKKIDKIIFLILMLSLELFIVSFYIANMLLLFNINKWLELSFIEFFSNYWINLDYGIKHIEYAFVVICLMLIIIYFLVNKCSNSCSKEPLKNDKGV